MVALSGNAAYSGGAAWGHGAGMDDSAIVNYEVYVQEQGRWTLQMRFRGDERELALSEAHDAERRLNRAVKVTRETYFPRTNTADEAVVYLSPRLRSTPAPAAARPVRPARPLPPMRKPAPPPPSRILMTFRVLLVIAIALSVSIFVVGMASVAMVQLEGMGIALTQDTYSKVIFVMFIAGFLFSAMPLSLYFLREVNEPVPAAARPRRRPRRPPPPRPRQKEEQKEVEDAAAPEPPPEDDPDDLADIDADIEDEDAADDDGHEDVGSDEDDGDEGAAEPEAETPAGNGDDEEDADGDEPEESTETAERDTSAVAAGEAARLTAMRFLGDVLAALKKEERTLNSYTRFGLNLMMAGAVEAIGERSGLGPRARRKLLREVVTLLGAPAAMAKSFASNYEGYLLEPRYLDMVRAGRESLLHYTGGGEQPLNEIAQALAAWERPTPAQAGQRMMAVMFTDMVGSTHMTQRLGDLGAQEVVRRHNSIVRQALTEHRGREVKHTGDGIMASFDSAGEAVDAAIAIQRMVDAHNSQRPDLPLHLRIGINAGEPVQEEDDLFGSPVQLAARVCDKAGSEEIFVTNVVRELSRGGGRAFRARGDYPLKGIAEPQPLFEALWREADAEAEPPAPAEEPTNAPAAGEETAEPAEATPPPADEAAADADGADDAQPAATDDNAPS